MVAVRNDARWEQVEVFRKTAAQLLHERAGDALVAAAEDGHAASADLQLAGQHFRHGGFPGAADGQIPDADHRAPEFLGAEETAPVKSEPRLHGALVEAGETAEDEFQRVGPSALAAFENDINGVAFEAFENDPHGQASRVTPPLSAASTWTRASGSTDCRAAATGAGSPVVRQATADPDPLR